MLRSLIWPLVALPCFALPLVAQGTAGSSGNIPFEEYRLDNGLHVILAQDESAPVVAVDVWYDVGSRDERPGRTGFAHLFEHMMFQGSGNVEKGGHMQLIERAGGSLNGTTSADRTNYYETLPANRLNLGLWLEADRMRSLAITGENFENQREVVKEERRMRVDNQPYAGAFRRALFEIPYNSESCFAYGHETIGSMDDLNAAEVPDVQDFFRMYYAPNNATLAVVGDFDPAQAKQMIEEYFGGIPSAAEPPPVQCEQPFTHLPVREVIEDSNANLPAHLAVYGITPANHPDAYALDLLALILGQGESSRLNQRLVQQDKLALQASAAADARRGPGVFYTLTIANQGKSIEEIANTIDAEIARIRDNGVTAEELDKAKNGYRSRTILGRQAAFSKAEALQYYKHFHGDAAAVSEDLDRYMGVTAEDIRRVANEYLVPDNRAVVIVQPASAQEN